MNKSLVLLSLVSAFTMTACVPLDSKLWDTIQVPSPTRQGTPTASAEIWHIREGVNWEWSGQWTRQGNTNQFSCWQQSNTGSTLTATIIVTENGNVVSAQKGNSSDGSSCNYSGTRQGNSVAGTYYCGSRGPYNWSATIGY